MKKLIICLFSIFCLFSCCNNDPNNSYEIIKATNNDLQVELIYNNEIGTDNLGQKMNHHFKEFMFLNSEVISILILMDFAVQV